mmetsp:Transcript_46897/g.118174  ORF Transcript_46897/g.118174 Transcript_46897/m.118174 type:complete len:229 (-) Transcript_46897:550-1236(-)
MVCLVPALQAAQDGDGVHNRRLAHQHLLEAALKRGVLLHVLAVLGQRGGADAAQLPARQGGLHQVAGVHAALARGPRAQHKVDLVDEEDDLPLCLLHFFQHGLQALLKLSAVLCTSNQGAHVQRHYGAVQVGGDVPSDDALSQPFNDRGLPNARLADEDGIVLGAPAEHTDDSTHLVVAPNDGVQLALPRQLGKVLAVLVQRVVAALCMLVCDLAVAAQLLGGSLHGA